MPFREWQPQYAAHGIATFPVLVGPDGKKPLVSNYSRFGLRASTQIARKFPEANAFGFMLGKRSGLTVLDVDSPNDRDLADALDRHGHTPIIVRSGSGNHQAWYRNNGEKRLVRPEPDKPIDILGDGFVVAPPSHGTKSDYQFIEGGLNDLDHLPYLRSAPANVNGRRGAAAPQDTERVRKGARNTNLFKHCMREAHQCEDRDALFDVARKRNAEFSPPLPDDEVMKIANSASSYTKRGANRFGRPGVFFDAAEVNELVGDHTDLFVIVSLLRANNKPDSRFCATNQGLAKRLHWSRKRVAAARRQMIAKGYAIQIRTARPKEPALYRWSKGGPK